MAYDDPRAALEALRARLYQLGWSDPIEPVFAEGTIHLGTSNRNVNEQLSKLIELSERSCLIVPGRDSYRRQRDGQTLITHRVFEVYVFYLDATITVGEESLAFFGDDTTPGVFNVHEGSRDLVEAMPLDPENLPHAWCAVDEGNPAIFAKDDDGPAKEGYVQTISIALGTKRRTLGRTAHATT
ncbi:MAG: hypothetical protein E1N59_2833 [Puniceicoccaceae bacterium 5H]|nr:MAG: hypothetical protein E1N59_2833 [Puniceicoccaceae bacterium 5H]